VGHLLVCICHIHTLLQEQSAYHCVSVCAWVHFVGECGWGGVGVLVYMCVCEHVFESHLRQFIFARINDYIAAYTHLHHSTVYMHQHIAECTHPTHTITIQPQQLSHTHNTCHIGTLLLSKTQFEVTLRRILMAILFAPPGRHFSLYRRRVSPPDPRPESRDRGCFSISWVGS